MSAIDIRGRLRQQPAGSLRGAARQIDCDQSHTAIPHPCEAHRRVAGDVREVPAVRRQGWLRIDTIEVRDNQRSHGATVHQRLREGKASHMETLLHYYAYGKPRETVEQTGPPQQMLIRIEKPWSDGA